MKIIAICVLIIAFIIYSPFQVVQFDSWQLPLIIADLSWVGLELFGALLAVVAVIAAIALVSAGLLGAGLIIAVGVVLTLLFGTAMPALPSFAIT